MISTIGSVLQDLDKSMGMMSRERLLDLLESDSDVSIIDLRSADAWAISHIPHSRQMNIQDLPSQCSSVWPNRQSTIVCVCNGSVQSAMAMVFLRSKGYQKAYNLSGGFSGWLHASLPVETQQ